MLGKYLALPVLMLSVIVSRSSRSSFSLSLSRSISSEILALALLPDFLIFLGEQEGDIARLFFVFRGDGVEGEDEEIGELSAEDVESCFFLKKH